MLPSAISTRFPHNPQATILRRVFSDQTGDPPITCHGAASPARQPRFTHRIFVRMQKMCAAATTRRECAAVLLLVRSYGGARSSLLSRFFADGNVGSSVAHRSGTRPQDHSSRNTPSNVWMVLALDPGIRPDQGDLRPSLLLARPGPQTAATAPSLTLCIHWSIIHG
jgi:hypothetical protein